MPKTVKVKFSKDPKAKTKKSVKSEKKPVAKDFVKTDMSVVKLLPEKKDEVKKVSRIKKLDLKLKKGKLVEKFKNADKKRLKKIYTYSSIVIIFGIIILLILPALPTLNYTFNPPIPDKLNYKIPVSAPFKIAEDAKPVPSGNRLVIPKIGVDTPIVDGVDINILNSEEGVWREIRSRSPETIGNMTLAGHRYQYLPPNMTTFYNLDKVSDGDNIIIFWNEKTYIYQVYTTFEVTPEHVEILNDSKEIPHELTLYTCTPIYTSANRLVVKAKLVS